MVYDDVILKLKNPEYIYAFNQDFKDCTYDKRHKIIVSKEFLILNLKKIVKSIIKGYVVILLKDYLDENSINQRDKAYIYNKIMDNFCFASRYSLLEDVTNKLVFTLEKNLEISVDGFAMFAMHEYNDRIYSIVDKIIEQIRAEEEFEEFVDILRFYIKTEPPGYGVLNIVICNDNRYKYLDENKKDVTEEWIDIFYEETDDAYVSQDDMLISLLITMQPEKIIIHNIKNAVNKKLMQTIKSVFTNRVEICSDNCDICRQ